MRQSRFFGSASSAAFRFSGAFGPWCTVTSYGVWSVPKKTMGNRWEGINDGPMFRGHNSKHSSKNLERTYWFHWLRESCPSLTHSTSRYRNLEVINFLGFLFLTCFPSPETGIWLAFSLKGTIRISFFCWKKKKTLGATGILFGKRCSRYWRGLRGLMYSEGHSLPGVCQGIKKRILRESSTKTKY